MGIKTNYLHPSEIEATYKDKSFLAGYIRLKCLPSHYQKIENGMVLDFAENDDLVGIEVITRKTSFAEILEVLNKYVP